MGELSLPWISLEKDLALDPFSKFQKGAAFYERGTPVVD